MNWQNRSRAYGENEPEARIDRVAPMPPER